MFSESENQKLQTLDLCTDVKSQTACPLGFTRVNYPNIIQPIAKKLPSSIRSKWKNEVARYGDKNSAAYPPLASFAKPIEEHAKIKNNSNILTSKAKDTKSTPNDKKPPTFRPALSGEKKKSL